MKHRSKKQRSSSTKGNPIEVASSARNLALSLLGEIIEKVTNDDTDEGMVGIEEKTSLLEENFSESEVWENDEGPRLEQKRPAWVEPKRGRKIQTTSLLLKRKRKIKRRSKQKRVLRLRGGGGDDDEGGMNSNDDEDSDDEMNTEEDEGKVQPSNKDREEASCRDEAMEESEIDNQARTAAKDEPEISRQAMTEESSDKEGEGGKKFAINNEK